LPLSKENIVGAEGYSMNCRIYLLALLLFLLGGCADKASQVDEQPQPKPHYTLGLSHLQSGNPTLALKEFLQAVAANPENPDVHAGLALAYQSKKAYELAEKHYVQALQLSDNDPKILNNLATLYIALERWDEALEYFNKAAENLLFMRTELALMGKGYVYYRQGHYQKSLDAYREAEAIAPRMPTLHFHVAETYVALGLNDAARASYEKALVYASGYSEARYQLAVLLLKEKKFEPAKAQLSLIVEQDPLSDWGSRAAEILKTVN